MLPEPLSLYIHVPFCRSRCGYCSFFTCVDSEGRQHRKWLDLLVDEWRHWEPVFRQRGTTSVYIGGGTPSLLALNLWEELLDILDLESLRSAHTPRDRFATLEANPGTLTQEKLDLWASGGIGRLSLGVQSFDPRVRKASRREVSQGELEEALDLLSSHWTGQLSLDLICGLPGQDGKSVTQDLNKILSYDPGHLSLYEFIREPGTPLDRLIHRGLSHPSESQRQKWWLQARDRLEEAGYSNYEISNFARLGQESLHNQVYWSGKPYVGLGPGAHSFFPGDVGWIRKENPESWDWPGGTDPWGTPEIEFLGTSELVKDLFLSALRTRSGLNKARFHQMTGLPAFWLRDGIGKDDQRWYREDEETWGLTAEGRDRMDWLLLRYNFDRL